MKRKLYKSMVELTSNPIYTALLKQFATSPFSGKLVRSFSKVYKVSEEEMEKDIAEYATINDFFIRTLKDGARPIDSMENSVVSPVDGKISQLGTIDEKASFFIKEKEYTLWRLLGLKHTAERYIGGKYILFYLSPKDYHRIHSPVSGSVVKRWALGKYSEPVNQLGLLLGDQPLATNYRLMTEMKTNDHSLLLAKIGALNVNSIHTTHVNKMIKKGEELAYFTFGSSVIMLFEKGMIEFLLNENDRDIPIKQGEAIAKLI